MPMIYTRGAGILKVWLQLPTTVKINSRTVNKIGFTIWNVEGKKQAVYWRRKDGDFAYGRSFETIQ